MTTEKKKRLLVFIVAYNAERTIQKVIHRIPESLSNKYHVEILVIDDASKDATFEAGNSLKHTGSVQFPLHVLVNPENQGYGGNQKLGYQYAIRNDFDFVALIHGDGQYAPELLPALLEPLNENAADAVFGSRMLKAGDAIRGGMPLYKYFGNKVLTWFENKILRASLSEFHSGYRIYSTKALRCIPFERNTDDFHFDTEIIIQLITAGMRIRELPIPTYYGDEICHVNGISYAYKVALSVLKARAQHWGVFFEPKFDCAPASIANAQYVLKRGYDSTHEAALGLVAEKSNVLDLGCAGGYLGQILRREKGCQVTGADSFPLPSGVELDNYFQCDLDEYLPNIDYSKFDYVLMLDVIEHLSAPEKFIENLHVTLSSNQHCRLIISTGNVAFIVVRLMLLLGQFNYGKRGILDLTHKRLFTFASLRRLLEQSGFKVMVTRSVPAPFPLAVGCGIFGKFLLAVNTGLIKISKSLFAYQIMLVAKPMPMVSDLLERAAVEAIDRVGAAK